MTCVGRTPSCVSRTAPRFEAGSVLTISTSRPASPRRTALAHAKDVLPTPPLPVKKRWRGACLINSSQWDCWPSPPIASLTLLLLSAELVIRARRIAAVNRRRPTSHVNGERNSFEDLLSCRTLLVRHLRMVDNAAFTMDGDADGERHQFLSLSVDCVRCRTCRRQRGECLHCVRRTLPQQSHTGYHVIGDLREILGHGLSFRLLGAGVTGDAAIFICPISGE